MILYCQRCLTISYRFDLVGFMTSEVCFQPPSRPIGKVSALVMSLCVCLTLYKVHCRVGMSQDCEDEPQVFEIVNHQGILVKLCSVSNGGSLLSVLTQFIVHSTLWCLVVGVIWLTWPRKCFAG